MTPTHTHVSSFATASIFGLMVAAGLFCEILPAHSIQAHRQAPSTFNAFLAQSNRRLILAEIEAWKSPWTVLTMAPNGSWGVATEMSTNLAIAKAIANCKKMYKKEIGCGAYSTTIRAGWSLAIRCGSENIIVAEKILSDAKKAAIAREIDLRVNYARDMPACVRILTVDPHGVIVFENFEFTRRHGNGAGERK